jgi:hypothetical protein
LHQHYRAISQSMYCPDLIAPDHTFSPLVPERDSDPLRWSLLSSARNAFASSARHIGSDF